MLYDKIMNLKKKLPKLSTQEEGAVVVTVCLFIMAIRALHLNERFPDFSVLGAEYGEVNHLINICRFIPIISVVIVAAIGWGSFFYIKNRKKRKLEEEPKREFSAKKKDIGSVLQDAEKRSLRENVFALRDGLGSLYDALSGKLKKL